ncbi:MAG TPA: ATP-binding protein [Candidatus Saccharimonadales bacterium]|nr:ATP-binding protein [Candidatus Saccharimonadales bacterium]
MRTANPELLITTGLTGSGKTFFAEQLGTSVGAYFLDVDELRLAVTDNEPTFASPESAAVYRVATYFAGSHLLQGHSIICNGNYNQAARRESMRIMAEQHSALCLTIWIDAPDEVLRHRMQTRNHIFLSEQMNLQPLELLEHMQATFESPQDEQGVIRIDGTAPFQAQVTSFKNQRRRLLGV